MGKFRLKWLKTGAFPRHIPVLLTVRSASPGMSINEPKFYTGTSDLLVFKVVFGSFVALVSKSIEKSGAKFGSWG